ncbi:MAG: amidohydrolase family protein [Pseudomonadota bacterium]|nr:amidohydrolase family protein [Pseudomonadota bacterium]
MAGKRILFKGAHLVTMDDTLGDFEVGDVLIEGREIAAVAAQIDEPVDEVVDATDQIIIPGLIDTHIHMWEMPLRGMSHTINHPVQYFSYVYPRRGVFEAEDVYVGVYACGLELISNGTTTVLDFCHCVNTRPHAEQAVKGLRDSGIRGVHGHSIGVRSPLVEFASDDQRFADAERVREEVVQDDGDGLLSMMIGLSERQHGADMELFKREIDFARHHNMRMTLHSLQELHVTALHQAGLLGSDMLPVHCTQASREELDIMAKFEVPISFAVACGFKREASTMIRWAAERGVQLTWSCDVATLHDPNLFAQMKLVYDMEQHYDAIEDRMNAMTPRSTPTLSARDVLRGGTIGAAKAIGMEHRIGSITPGKQADLVIMDLPLAGPSLGDVCNHILLQSGARDVNSVLIAGEFRKRDGEMLNIDRARVRRMVAEVRERVLARPFTPKAEWPFPPHNWSTVVNR